MKKLIILAIIIMTFGGCSTQRKISKNESLVRVQNDDEINKAFELESTKSKVGKTDVIELSAVEEIKIKQPHQIELTANFRIDSAATLRGDTALKLVDISDKNVSVTIYQNGKNGQLTAQIRSKNSIENVPFSEISIKKSSTNKIVKVDTSKVENVKVKEQIQIKDKSKTEVNESSVQKDVKKANYLVLIGLGLLIVIVFWILNKKWF
ncbi:hypothetical protein OQZ33_07150 [Pedobacter sp. MC2016-05]|uniref:hypothetical protein n=1 Tax=Pedobacter sp. MC2016-05 TaxID=2994474 RepID=UPI0022455F36|nr:hypothetical protein [Pedobacter sp. MC2016-05]MCX2474102.1 hypothetical protein [Pedobacter sp. MC2016-05]